MAGVDHATRLNVYSTYYEGILVLSVGISVDKHQLVIETTHTNQSAVLRYNDDYILSLESLKKHLVAVVCPVMGVHNVARVRQGNLPLFELDFTGRVTLMTFCKSLNGKLGYSCTLYVQQAELCV